MVSGAKPAKLLRRKVVGFQSEMKTRGISGVKEKNTWERGVLITSAAENLLVQTGGVPSSD